MNYSKKLGLVLALALTLGACSTPSENEPKFMVGNAEKAALFSKYQTFEQGFNSHLVTDADKALVNDWPSDLHIDVYFGTWCHDSEREVPRFLKLLEKSKVSYQLIALDYYKEDPKGRAANDAVKFTPTFVVKRSGKEIGRIVEYTKNGFAQDITAFINK